MIERSSEFGAGEPLLPPDVLQAWELACSSRANMMIIGPEPLLMRLVGRIAAALRDSILIIPGSSFSVPMLEGASTLVLRDVDTMPVESQSQLLDRLETSRSPQIISAATQSLFPRVGSTVLDSLYYLLNTVHVETQWPSSAARLTVGQTVPIDRAAERPAVGQTVSIDRAAELLNVSRRTVYNRIREGSLQTIRTLGGSQRVTLESIAELRNTSPKPTVLTWVPTGT